MENSKRIAGLIGPSLIAITISEALNVHIWAANIAPVIHLNGALLFVAGLSIVRAHNHWIRGWPVIVTLVGWFAILAGLLRMFAPELYLQSVQNTSAMMLIASIMIVCAIGIYLTFKAYGREDS
ncbi:MAG TPA: hypothetical protein VIF37_08530 [Methylobacter sp.]|jgi:hypothetical protein